MKKDNFATNYYGNCNCFRICFCPENATTDLIASDNCGTLDQEEQKVPNPQEAAPHHDNSEEDEPQCPVKTST